MTDLSLLYISNDILSIYRYVTQHKVIINNRVSWVYSRIAKRRVSLANFSWSARHENVGSCKYIIQICHRQSVVLGDIQHMVASHDVFPPLFPFSLYLPHPPPCPFCSIAVNSLTHLRTASLAFACTIPCVYADIISFSASPAASQNEVGTAPRSPIGPQWGHNLIYRCTTSPSSWPR